MTTNLRNLSAVLAVYISDLTVVIAGHTVLDEVSLEVPQGIVMGLLGSNGAGKTTILSVLAGQRRPTKGSVTVLGEKLPRHGRSTLGRIGIVPQETSLYDELTVAEQLQLFADLQGISKVQCKVETSLGFLGLTEVANIRAGVLSGGMRRRVVIARALLHQPDLLLIDEPTLAVDAETRHLIWRHLRRLRNQGRTVVMATNYLEEASAVCDQAVVLGHGRVLSNEPMLQLVARSGICIEVACDSAEVEQVTAQVTELLRGLDENLVRIHTHVDGITIILHNADRAASVSAALCGVHGLSVRSRPAELAEAIRLLELRN